MKSKTMLVAVLVTASLPITACAGIVEQATKLKVSFDDFQFSHSIERAIEVDAGDTFEVSLFSNRTTGFQWPEFANIIDDSIIKQTDYEYVPPESDLVGAGGKEIWIFEAVRQGTTSITLEYNQPWEGGIKAEWTFDLKVTVK